MTGQFLDPDFSCTCLWSRNLGVHPPLPYFLYIQIHEAIHVGENPNLAKVKCDLNHYHFLSCLGMVQIASCLQ